MSNAFRFVVRAADHAEALPRVIGHFARLGVVPARLLAEREPDTLRIVCDVTDIGESLADIIVGKLASSVLIAEVTLDRLSGT